MPTAVAVGETPGVKSTKLHRLWQKTTTEITCCAHSMVARSRHIHLL